MKKDKIIEYTLAIILSVVLFFDFFVLNIFKNKILLAMFLGLYAIMCEIIIKSRKVDNTNKKTVITLMTIFGFIYVITLYLIGIFVGFYKNPSALGLKTINNKILANAMLIIFMELIRGKFIERKRKFSTILVTIGLVLVDVTTYIYSYNFSVLEDVLTLIGYVILSSISVNLLCNYIAKRYGIIPNIIYRIITVIYTYIFPILPDIYLFFQTTFRILYPYMIYLVIDNLLERETFKVAIENRKVSFISFIIEIIVVIGIVLLISCNFKYGVIVVGSSSMSKNINKGDAVVYERYENQTLEEGQVIIFYKDDIRMIHRIQDVQVLNGEHIYYTKGDNNQQQDEGYRKAKDIMGVVKLKVIYIGWPTIWVNDLFEH